VNSLKTTMLLATLAVLLMTAGYYIGDSIDGSGGSMKWAVIAFAAAMAMNFVSFWFSDKIVLKVCKAQEIGRADSPQLYGIVERLAAKARMPMPKVYVIPENTPNAFATGRSPSHAAVAATYGILKILSMEELEGVMAHELSHVKNRDTLISTIAATLGGAIGFLARIFMYAPRGGNRDGKSQLIGILITVIVAPIAAMMIQMAVSRSREYIADESGARMCGNPNALASALEKLQRGVTAMPMETTGNPAMSHMFIINPFKRDMLARLFSTHPPTEERVMRLRDMRI